MVFQCPCLRQCSASNRTMNSLARPGTRTLNSHPSLDLWHADSLSAIHSFKTSTDNVSAPFSIMPTSECIDTFNQLKLGRTGMKYMVLEIKNNQVVVADTSSDKDWDSFYNRMMQADESGNFGGAEVTLSRSKLCLICFIPEETTVKVRSSQNRWLRPIAH